MNVIGFKCFECAREFRGEVEYVCPVCGGNLDVLYDYDAVAARLTKERLAADRNLSMWRYRPLRARRHVREPAKAIRHLRARIGPCGEGRSAHHLRRDRRAGRRQLR